MKHLKIGIGLMFVAATLLRLSLITVYHHGDLNNNISWGTIAYEKGFKDFYEGYRVKTEDNNTEQKLPIRENGEVAWPYSAPNQPPLTIELFALCKLIWQKIRDFIWYMNWTLLIFPSKLVWFWDEKGIDIMIKLPSIIADLGIGYLVYQFVTKITKKSTKIAFVLSATWLFNPLTWYNSAVWGQTDSIVNFLGLSAIYFLFKKKLPLFGVIFTLSLLFKGSLFIFIPVLLYWIIIQKYTLKTWAKTVVCSLLTVVFVVVWFHPHVDLFIWLTNLYQKRLLPGEIDFLSVNAFNFWWLVNPGKIMDSTVYFGLPARIWGFIISLSGILLIFKSLSISRKKNLIFLALALSSLVTFLFLTRIHERYLYPFFPSATIGLSIAPFYWPVYAVLSAVFLINQYYLFWVPSLSGLRSLLGDLWFSDFLSLINITMLLVSFRLLKSRKV